MGKKISKMESSYEETTENLQKASVKLGQFFIFIFIYSSFIHKLIIHLLIWSYHLTILEEKEKELKEKEGDLSTLSRRVILMEDEVRRVRTSP